MAQARNAAKGCATVYVCFAVVVDVVVDLRHSASICSALICGTAQFTQMPNYDRRAWQAICAICGVGEELERGMSCVSRVSWQVHRRCRIWAVCMHCSHCWLLNAGASAHPFSVAAVMTCCSCSAAAHGDCIGRHRHHPHSLGLEHDQPPPHDTLEQWTCGVCLHQKSLKVAAVQTAVADTGSTAVPSDAPVKATPQTEKQAPRDEAFAPIAAAAVKPQADVRSRLAATLTEMYRKCLLHLVQPGWSVDISQIPANQLEEFPLNSFLEYTKSTVEQRLMTSLATADALEGELVEAETERLNLKHRLRSLSAEAMAALQGSTPQAAVESTPKDTGDGRPPAHTTVNASASVLSVGSEDGGVAAEV